MPTSFLWTLLFSPRNPPIRLQPWKNPEEGQLVETCSIITTMPNALLADVHDRMAVILPDYAYDLWLDPGLQKTDAICEVLKPFDPALIR